MILEGRLVTPIGEEYGQVVINDSGLIEKVGPELGTADLVASGLIFPGFVDVHVHAREDTSGKEIYKEDFRSMSEAAIHGGVVAVADMPNNLIVPVSEEFYAAKQTLARTSLVDVLLYSALIPGSKPLSQLVPYKAFLSQSVGSLFFSSFDELKETIGEYRGQFVSFHCEDPEILKAHAKAQSHEQQRPREAEASAVDFVLKLTAEHKLRSKICHVSTKEALEKIIAARKSGLPVTCEVTPHHLYFDETGVSDSTRKLLQVNPPLRSKADRQALLSALKTGNIDFLATDHAPHTIAEKKQGISGIPQLDTLGAFASWLMREQGFSPQDISRVCAENPGRFISHFTAQKFGRIAKGYVGSFTIIDPDSPLTVRKQDIKTKCGWSPFEGITFPGRVTHTIIRGKVYGI